MELFLELENTLNEAVTGDNYDDARQAYNEMATQIHSVPDQRVRFQAEAKLNMAKEKIDRMASDRLVLNDSIDQSNN